MYKKLVSRLAPSMAQGGSSWGQKELISLFAVYIFVVDISKELLYNAKTSHNKAVKVRRLSAARLHKNVFGLRPLHVFVPPHFCKPCKLLRSLPIRACKNVFYRRTLSEKNRHMFEDYFTEIIHRSTPSMAWGFDHFLFLY